MSDPAAGADGATVTTDGTPPPAASGSCDLCLADGHVDSDRELVTVSCAVCGAAEYTHSVSESVADPTDAAKTAVLTREVTSPIMFSRPVDHVGSTVWECPVCGAKNTHSG